ncbi:rod shape-determining protein [Streptomyces fradiae]|uniref:rod shape-determining protein n=1 Tax=Streptomyces fradiae TaxID=1906 RepID=UPI000A37B342|nr:rod shape-determining protein [Streptomyces fradiae]
MSDTKREIERKYEATTDTRVPDLTRVRGVARVADAGTADLDAGTTPDDLADAAADMVTDMFRADRTPRSAEALRRGILLTGGGALRPETAAGLGARLRAPVRAAPAPHTAAVRGAATTLVPDARNTPDTPDALHAPDAPDAPDALNAPHVLNASDIPDVPEP